MSLMDIFEWISSSVSYGWNWLIHADLTVGLSWFFTAFMCIGLCMVVYEQFTKKSDSPLSTKRSDGLLATAYQKYPVMGKVYLFTLFSMAAFGALFLVGIALALAGYSSMAVLAGVSLFLTIVFLIASILLRKP